MISGIPSLLRESLRVLHGLALLLILLTFFTLCIPIYVFRWCVTTYAAHFLKGKLGKPVCPVGNLFSVEFLPNAISRPPKCAISARLVLDGILTMEEITSLITERWFEGGGPSNCVYPELIQYPETFMGFMFWKQDPHFEFSNHIKFLRLEGETDEEVEQNLTQLTEELLNKPFHPKRSPWECFVVHNYRNSKLNAECENKEMTLLVARVHHVLADGYSAVYAILERLLGTSLQEIQFPTPKQLGINSSKDKFLFGLSFPLRLLRDLSTYANLSFGPVTPFHALNKDQNRFISVRSPSSIHIGKIKTIKDKLGASFTAVLLSCVASAMSKTIYSLQKRGGKIIESVTTHTPLPLPGHPKELVNHITLAIFQLPTSPELSSLERLRKTEAVLDAAKKNTIPIIFYFIIKGLGTLFSQMTAFLTKNRGIPAGVTNFPGPGVEVRVNGKRAVEVDFVAGLLPGIMGLGILLISLKDKIRVCVVADSGVMERKVLKEVVGYVDHEIECLYQLALEIK